MDQKIVTFDVALKSTERQWVQKIPEVYTNDLGSVSLQFRINDCTDPELAGSTAIVLLKMRDGSFFQGPSTDVTRTLNVFSYTLKENEGNHDGLAEIQLIVTIDAKEFATQKYNFKVITGLDSEVAREIMIYDWSTLTAEARAYIDQFTADELLRDAEFDNNQFDRNVAFNTAQGQRDTDFGSAQAQRVTDFNAAEAARVLAFNNAETARAAGYDADHSRAETDHTLAASDHTTAAADHTIVQGYNTRLTAEETATANNKVSAVKGKTFADVDARLEELEKQAITVDARTEFEARNLITNGDFSNGVTTGWLGYMASVTNENGKLKVTATAAGPYAQAYMTLSTIVGNKYYIRQTYPPGTVSPSIVNPAVSSASSSIFTATQISTQIKYSSGTVVIGDYYYIDDVIIIDLTAAFGAGKEPTLAEMDRLMARFPNSWFDGVKPIQTIETLYHEKVNKVQAAWITPTLTNGWKSVSPDRTIQYMKDEFGFVHFRGDLDPALKSLDNGINLTAGYRPSRTMFWDIRQGYIAVTSSGQIQSVGISGWHTFSVISFRAEQ